MVISSLRCNKKECVHERWRWLTVNVREQNINNSIIEDMSPNNEISQHYETNGFVIQRGQMTEDPQVTCPRKSQRKRASNIRMVGYAW